MVSMLAAISGCSESPVMEMEVPISGKLVYVEDFAGRHGVLAGRFGDLVLIDGNENKRYALTDDHYYYAYPNLVNGGREVWFESKRGDDLWPAGLGSRSDLYSLDVETRQVRNIRDSLSTVFGVQLKEGIDRISISPTESKMVFQMSDLEKGSPIGSRSFFYVDKNEQELKRVEDRLSIGPDNVYWSSDEMKLAYERMVRYGLVYTYDLERHEKNLLTNELLETGSRVLCRTGSWQNNKVFVYMCKENVGNRSLIYKFNYEEDTTTVVAEIIKDNFLIRSLHISDDGSYLVFIGITSVDYKIVESGIYVYNLETEEMQSFAVNKREKRWMRWYEDL